MTASDTEAQAHEVEVSASQLFLGEPEAGFAEALRSELGTAVAEAIVLGKNDWSSTSWQMKRKPCVVWVIVTMADGGREETQRWVQLLSVILRPTRLLVLAPALGLEQSINLVKAGADGILPRGTAAAEIVRHLREDGLSAQNLLPDPREWLSVLRRAGEELLDSESPGQVLQRLLRLCSYQLRADRATLFLTLPHGRGVELVAGLSVPGNLKVGDRIQPDPSSITAWILKNARPLILQGKQGSARQKGDDSDGRNVTSAVSAPLMHKGQCLGVVNISSSNAEREFGPADLAMIEVFAQMAAFSIVNHRLVAQALESQRLATVGRTTANVSHCVKNFLQSLKGGLGIAMLGKDDSDRERLETGLRVANTACEHLSAMMLELLEFSKTRQPAPEPTSVSALLTELIEMHGAEAEHRSVCLAAECDPMPAMELDVDHLRRALINLIRNAIEALEAGGEVLVSARCDGGQLVFRVQDDGLGVPDDALGRIFEPFYSTKGNKGTGLGLPMVWKFAQENGGSVRAANLPECGFAVEIRLPARPVEASPAS